MMGADTKKSIRTEGVQLTMPKLSSFFTLVNNLRHLLTLDAMSLDDHVSLLWLEHAVFFFFFQNVSLTLVFMDSAFKFCMVIW